MAVPADPCDMVLDIFPPRGLRIMAPQRKKKMTRLSSMLDGFVAPSVRKRGFVMSRLVSEWPMIAGDMATWSRPSQMNLSRDGGGRLKLAIASGFGPVALQMRGQMIERVNAAFGYRAVSDITFVQTLPPVAKTTPGATPSTMSAAMSGARSSQTGTGNKSGSGAAICGQTVWDLDRKLEHVRSPELRAALRRLGTDD